MNTTPTFNSITRDPKICHEDLKFLSDLMYSGDKKMSPVRQKVITRKHQLDRIRSTNDKIISH